MPGSSTGLEASMLNYEPARIGQHAVDSDELAILIRAATVGGNAISFNAPGGSMYPFIHSGDKIVISPIDARSIRTGDVLTFVHNPSGRVLAHRVIKIEKDRYLCKGDNSAYQADGWIGFDDVLGRVERVLRNGKAIRLGLGPEKLVIALLSRWKILVPIFDFRRRIKRRIKRLISARD
jgi:signal peptidase I